MSMIIKFFVKFFLFCAKLWRQFCASRYNRTGYWFWLARWKGAIQLISELEFYEKK